MTHLNMEKDSIQIFFEIKSHISFYSLTVSFTLCKMRDVSFWYP